MRNYQGINTRYEQRLARAMLRRQDIDTRYLQQLKHRRWSWVLQKRV